MQPLTKNKSMDWNCEVAWCLMSTTVTGGRVRRLPRCLPKLDAENIANGT